MFRLLDRYVVRECVGPFSLGLLVFSFMLLINLLFRLAEMIIQRDVPAATIGELLLVSLPNILVLTIPMGLLFGVLIAIGRLASDSELIAMRASGISLFALYRPVMVFSLAITAITAWLMLDLLPKGNTRVERIQMEIFTRSVNKQVEPGIFYDGLADKMLFVSETTDNGWNGVFLSDALPGRNHVIQVARRGRVSVEDDSTLRLDLVDSKTHQVDLARPDRYDLSGGSTTSVILEDRILEKQADRRERKSYESMTIPELRAWREDPDRSVRERRIAEIEIHQKFAIPAACLVFGLFAVPLGYNNRRGGRSSGFALSIPIILGYRIIQSNGEGAAVDGKIEPWLAMWLPNAVFLVAGLFLLARRNRDKSLLFSRIDRWVRLHLWGALRKRTRLRRRRKHRRREVRTRRRGERRSRRSDSSRDGESDAEETGSFDTGAFDTDSFDTGSFDTGSFRAGALDATGEPPDRGDRPADLVVRLPHFRLAFPTLIDRYLLRTFLRVFVLVVLAGMAVYVMADLTEMFGAILDNDISTSTVVDYYQVLSFQIFRDLSPLMVLLTILISFGVLSRSSEIIAAKAAGLSLYRLAAPALFAAALVAGANLILERTVLPYSSARADHLEDVIKAREQPLRTYRRADRQWLYGAGGTIYHFQHFDPEADRIQRLHVFRLDPESGAITKRLYTQEAEYRGGRWQVAGAWARTFEGTRVASFDSLEDGKAVDIPEQPDFFDMEIRAPRHMESSELASYIRGLQQSGQAVEQLRVQFLNRTAMPMISLVMCFVALPFAFRLGRKGALYGIGLAIALGIVFYAVIAVFTTLGQAGSLPPQVAVWSPHVLFASLSLYLFLGVET